MISGKKIVKAEGIYLLLKDGKNWKRIGKILFLRDTSICFVFPNLSTGGILAESSCSTNSKEIQKIDLKNKGKVTSETVKFSYHPDGRVNFSMDRKIYTRIKMDTESLGLQNRHLFTCLYGNPRKFFNITNKDYERYSENGLVRISFGDEMPLSFSLSFHKYSLKEFDFSKYQKSSDVVLLSPDEKMSLRIIVQKKSIVPKLGEPLFIFVGGFKIDKTKLRFLSAMYPATKYDDLLKMLGTVDFKKQR